MVMVRTVVMAVAVIVAVRFMGVGMMMFMNVLQAVVLMPVLMVGVVMAVGLLDMHVELGARDRPPLLAADVQVKFMEAKFLQLAPQPARIHAQVKHRADEHVATDAAEDVEIERFHG
jgi:hypothetical protein